MRGPRRFDRAAFVLRPPVLPPLCKGRWRTNVSRRGCRSGAGEGGLLSEARSYPIPTTPQSNPSGLPAPLTQGSQAPRGDGKAKPRGRRGAGVQQNRPLRVRTGGSGGHFALGKKAPRRPFCPLSAGGKWTPFSAPVGAELTARCRPAFPQKRPRSGGSRFISFLLPFLPILRLFPAKQVLRGPLCI